MNTEKIRFDGFYLDLKDLEIRKKPEDDGEIAFMILQFFPANFSYGNIKGKIVGKRSLYRNEITNFQECTENWSNEKWISKARSYIRDSHMPNLNRLISFPYKYKDPREIFYDTGIYLVKNDMFTMEFFNNYFESIWEVKGKIQKNTLEINFDGQIDTFKFLEFQKPQSVL